MRRAGPADVEPAAAVLAQAFELYSWTSWTVDARDRLQRLVSLYEMVLGKLAVPYGAVWVCEEISTVRSRTVGAAGWFTPTTDVPTHMWRDVEAGEARLRGRRLEAHRAAESQLEAVRPDDPHWLLGAVGVLVAHRGRGLATRLLRPGLRAASEQRVVTYLETAEPANVRLYARLGFEVTDVQRIGGGPTVWSMWRRPDAPEAAGSHLSGGPAGER